MQQRQDREARANEKAGDRAFAAEQGALERQARVDSQQSQQEFQARLQFAEQQAVLMGDFGGYGKVLAELGVDETTAVASMAAAGGQFAEKADAKARDAWQANSKATLGAIEQEVATSPTNALNQIQVARGNLQRQIESAMGAASTDSTKGIIAAEGRAAYAQLGTLQEQAETAVLSLQFQTGEFSGIAEDSVPRQRVQRAMSDAGFGPDSAANSIYNAVASIRGQLGNLANVSLDDVRDPGIRSILSRFQDQENPPPGTLIGLAGQDPKVAADVLRDLQGITQEQLSVEAQSLSRLNSKVEFDKRLSVGLDSAARFAPVDVSFTPPSGAFTQDAEGNMTLSAKGASDMAAMFTAQFPSEGGTLDALKAVDNFVEAAGLEPGAAAGIKSLIAKDYQFIQEQQLSLDGPAESISAEVEAGVRRIPPVSAANLYKEIEGLPSREAAKRLGVHAKDIDLIREGGQVQGKKLISAILPTGPAARALLANIDNDLLIAESAGNTREQERLQAQGASLQALQNNAAVTRKIESTLFDITRAVARDDPESLYDTITADLRGRGFLDIVAVEEGSAPKDEFAAYVRGGATEGAKIQRAIEWINNKQLFRLGSSQQPTTELEGQFSNYLVSFGDDYADLVDDTLLTLDTGIRLADSKSTASTDLRYLTSTGSEWAELAGGIKAEKVPDLVDVPTAAPPTYGIIGVPHQENNSRRGNY
jgi:hypothetical protein